MPAVILVVTLVVTGGGGEDGSVRASESGQVTVPNLQSYLLTGDAWPIPNLAESVLLPGYAFAQVQDSTPPKFVSSKINSDTVLTITFSETIDATPVSNVVPAKIHIRESGSYAGGVTLTAPELDTASDSTTISFTLTAPHLAAVKAMDVPELTIEPGAVQDTSGNPIVSTFDISTATHVNVTSVRPHESQPRDMAFSNDGTKMFVIGTGGGNITEYALSAAFDLSAPAFVGATSISLQESEPHDITFSNDGTKMFVIGSQHGNITEYTLSAAFDLSSPTLVGSTSISFGEPRPRGMAFSNDGTKMFVIGTVKDAIIEYALSAAFDLSSPTLVGGTSISAQDQVPQDVVFSNDGTKMFVVGNSGDAIIEYALSAAFDPSTLTFVGATHVGSEEDIPSGMAFSNDGTKMFVIGNQDGEINEYALSSVYPIAVDFSPPTFDSSKFNPATGVLAIIFSEDIDATNVVPAKIHIRESGNYTGGVTLTAQEFDTASDSTAISFALTEPHLAAVAAMGVPELTIEPGAVRDTFGNLIVGTFDASTAAFVTTRSLTSGEIEPGDMAFSNDGTKMFVLDDNANAINEYTLSVAFDVGLRNFVDATSISDQESLPTGMAFSNDGTKMFVIGSSAGGAINEYTLSVAFDASTRNFVDATSISDQESLPTGMAFSNDGTKMFVIGSSAGGAINEYTLSVAFDASTRNFVDATSISDQESLPTGMAFSNDGTKMFVIGSSAGGAINEYTLSVAFDASTRNFVDATPVSSDAYALTGMAFSNDGTRMFVIGSSNGIMREYALSSTHPITVDYSPPTFDSSKFNPATGVLTITFSEAIDVTPTTNVALAKMHIRESGNYAGGVTLTAQELDTASDSTTISFTLTEPHLAAVAAMDVPELTIELEAVRDILGNFITSTYDASSLVFIAEYGLLTDEPNPSGMAFSNDGTKMFVVGYEGDGLIYEYTLSPAFDLSTMALVNATSILSQERNAQDIAFSNDGLKMFVIGFDGQDINEYTLSAPFDASTRAFVNSTSIRSWETLPSGMAFSNDGTRMFVIGYSGDDINEYTLSTAFDPSTLAFVGNTPISQDEWPQDMAFSNDGTKMFVVGFDGSGIHEYTLSTAFDPSTLTFIDTTRFSRSESDPTGMEFSNDGTKMFVVGVARDKIQEYALNSIYPITVESAPDISSNSPPDVDAGSNHDAEEDSTVNLDGTASDADLLDNLTYSWSHNSALSLTLVDDSMLDTTFDAPNVPEDTVIEFTLTVFDDTVVVHDKILITILDSENSPPDVDAGDNKDAAEGSTVSLNGTVTDSDPEDALDYTWTHNSALSLTLADEKAVDTTFDAPNVPEDTVIEFHASDGTVTVSDKVLITILDSENSPPDVDAGDNKDAAEGSTVSLNGTVTDSDPEDALDYTWTHNSTGLAITLADGSMLDTTFDAPNVPEDTVIEFTLTASDGTVTVSDKVLITILDSENSPPDVDAGDNKDAAEGSTVSLNGTVTDSDPEDALDYTWTHNSALSLTLADEKAVDTTFDAPNVPEDTVIEFTLTASDGTVTVSDKVLITILDSENSPPDVDAGDNKDAAEGSTVSLNGTVTDSDPEDALDYTWTHNSTGLAITLADGSMLDTTFDAPNVPEDTVIEFTLTASDGTVTVSDKVLITILDSENSPPDVDAGDNKDAAEGSTVSLNGTVTDSDPEDALDYTWTHNSALSLTLADEKAVDTTFNAPNVPEDTVIEFTLTASDGTVTVSDKVLITILDSENSPPDVDAGDNKDAAEGSTVSLNGTVTDSDPEDALDYTWTHNSALSLTLADEKAVDTTFNAPNVPEDTVIEFTLTASDGTVTVSDKVLITILDSENSPPDVDAGDNKDAAEGSTVSLNGTVTDSDPEDALDYTWTHNSALSLTLADEKAVDTTFNAPNVPEDTVIEFTLTASDGTVTVSDKVLITILDSENSPPDVDAGDNKDAAEGSTVSLNGTVTDSDPEDALDYTWTHNSALSLTLADEKAVDTTFNAPNVPEDTVIEFTLTASDGTVTVSDKVLITILDSENSPPDVDAGDNRMPQRAPPCR